MNNGRSVIFNKMDSYGKSISNKVSSFNRKHSVKRWPQFGTDSHIDKKKFLRMGLLTISFYILTNSFQRLAGTFSIHGGQPFLAASSFGIISTTLSCLISREIQEYVLPVGFYKSRLNPFYEKQNSDDVTRRACLGVGVFSLLEKKMFRTALPSSLLSVGVHATNARRLPATGIVATEKQRNLIQILGKQLGCHQCGSKQFFSENKQFIADHMPPTKFASEMNENFWRKTTNMEVSLYFY